VSSPARQAESFDFQKNIATAVNDQKLRGNLRSAMDTLMEKRQAVFNDSDRIESLREIGQSIKARALSRLPKLLKQLEEKCTQNGITVHWAETPDSACRTVLEIMQSHQATRMVKGKSMVSEEMHLNKFLQRKGLEALETDLGEFIIQLAGETPSHIIVPAIHKNKDEIAQIFHEEIPDTPYTENVAELNTIARKTLRRKFFNGQVGLSGVNMAVAETGTLVLVENEGNGRMCTTVPPVHIAVMGLEKVVEKLADVPPLLRLLTGSATGQLITTYVNMITSPRKEDEKDGPHEVHLIILDNGRSGILPDPELRQTLTCIRCGTCLNHCPVYTRIGGHAYHFVYPGPIGKLLTPQMEGLENAGALPMASSLCDACNAVCPVKIPISNLLRRLRNENYAKGDGFPVRGRGAKANPREKAAWKAWRIVNTTPFLNNGLTRLTAIFGRKMPSIGPLAAWTRYRSAPKPATKTLRQMARQRGLQDG